MSPTAAAPRLRLLVGLVVALVVLGYFVSVFPQTLAIPTLLVVRGLTLAAFGAALVGWGLIATRLLGGRGPRDLIGSGALGLALTITCWGWLAPLVWAGRWIAAGWLVAGLVALGIGRGALVVDLGRPRATTVAVGGAWLILPTTLALAHPTLLDSLVYHLTLPRQFALAGRAIPTPWNAHGLLPLGGETLFGLALPIGGDILAALVHLAAALATLVVVCRIAARMGGEAAGRWAALVLGAVPVLAISAGAAYTDFLMLLPIAVALDILSRDPDATGQELELSLLLGAAAAIKSNALVMCLLVLPVWWRRGWLMRLAIAAVGVVAATPWAWRAWRASGDPFFPIFSDSPQAIALRGYREGVRGFELLAEMLGSRSVADEALGPAIAVAAVLLVCWGRRGQPALPGWSGWLASSYVGALLVIQPTARFLAPALLVLAIAAGGVLAEAVGVPRWGRAVRSVVVAAVVVAWVQTSVIWSREAPVEAAIGLEAPSIRQNRLPAGAVFSALDGNAPEDEGVLVVGESRVSDLDRPVFAGSWLDPHPLAALVPPSGPADPIADRAALASRGVRWVVAVPQQCVVGDRPPGSTHEVLFFYDAGSEARFVALLQQFGEVVMRTDNASLFRLADEPLPEPLAESDLPRCPVWPGGPLPTAAEMDEYLSRAGE